MHRAAYHFIKALGIKSLARKQQQKGGAEDDEEDDEADVDISVKLEASADDAEVMADTMVIDFELGDTVGKLLAFINQVRISSEGICEYLAHCCCLQDVKPIEILLWVWSRWGSLSHCLGTVLLVQKVWCFVVSFTLACTNVPEKPVDYFCLTADSNEELPPLQNKVWSDYRLTTPEWKLIGLVHKCLKVTVGFFVLSC